MCRVPFSYGRSEEPIRPSSGGRRGPVLHDGECRDRRPLGVPRDGGSRVKRQAAAERRLRGSLEDPETKEDE